MTGSPFTLNLANLIAVANEYGLYKHHNDSLPVDESFWAEEHDMLAVNLDRWDNNNYWLHANECQLFLVLKHANPHGQERARKLGHASSRGPETPIVVYNDPM